MNAVLRDAGFRWDGRGLYRGPADPAVGGYTVRARYVPGVGNGNPYRDPAAPVRLLLGRALSGGDWHWVREIDYPESASAVAALPADFPEAPPADWADHADTAAARRARFVRIAHPARRAYALAAVRYALTRPAVTAGLPPDVSAACLAVIDTASRRRLPGVGKRERVAAARAAVTTARGLADGLRGPVGTDRWGRPDPNARPRPLHNPAYRALRAVLDAGDPGTDPTHPTDRLARAAESAAALCTAFGDAVGVAGLDRIYAAFTAAAPAPEYRTDTVRALARSARDVGPAVLPVLADALSDAGYPDDALTAYLRDNPPGIPPAVAELAA